MNLTNLSEILKNEPAYREKQIKEAIFRKLIENWQEASFLPLVLREKLTRECPLEIKAKILPSRNNQVIKATIELSDGLKIETVLMRHDNERQTVCVSSEVGCPLGCLFCATGQMGFKRNLEPMEIIEQVLFFNRYLKNKDEKITNIVFMGMGEPFLNYDNVLSAIRILNDKNGLDIGARHISVSTVGIADGISRLAEEKLQINLAISLHAPNNELRDELIPCNKRYPIEKILKAVDEYIAKTNRQVMFEYILIKDKNDSDKIAEALAKIMKKRLYMVNLILYNPTGLFEPASTRGESTRGGPSTPMRVKKFKEILEEKGIKVTQRYRFGGVIKGACGQLVTK